jgi:hypothetical protein
MKLVVVITLLPQPKHLMSKQCAESKFREVLYRSPTRSELMTISGEMSWKALEKGKGPERRKGRRDCICATI